MADIAKRLSAYVVLAVLSAATALAGTGVAVARVAGGHDDSSHTGRLAGLLSAGRADQVARAVAPLANREVLSAAALQAAWDNATAAAGGLTSVARPLVITQNGDRTIELEVLRFAHGVGTLTAQHTAAGITGIYLLVGTPADTAAGADGAGYAMDLATGKFQDLAAHFDAQMTAGLPIDQLSTDTAVATAGLGRPATVAAELLIRRGTYTVVQTYLAFTNGLRRVEVTLTPSGRIAGLFLRSL